MPKPVITPDLKHKDWLINITIKRLQKIDTNIRFSIFNPVPEKKVLIIDNVSEESLGKLPFLTNTDTNNNYGYIENFQVYLKDDVPNIPVSIPGLYLNMFDAWTQADLEAFEKGSPTFIPFNTPFLNPYNGSSISVPEYVDIITRILPWATKTLGRVKIFKIYFNPDDCTNCSGLCINNECDGIEWP
jgi:hypothetical protein